MSILRNCNVAVSNGSRAPLEKSLGGEGGVAVIDTTSRQARVGRQ